MMNRWNAAACGRRIGLALLVSMAGGGARADGGGYAVVASKAVMEAPEWKAVVEALAAKHKGDVVVFEGGVVTAREKLAALHPRHTCFVAPPAEATKAFVMAVHDLARRLDDDPYTDTIWGVLTGYDASNALAIARRTEPLTVRRVLSGTDFALDRVEEGVWYDELVQAKVVRKAKDGEPVQSRGAPDSTADLAKALNDGWPDLLITSGHATERDWQIGYRFRGGSFRSKAGQMRAVDVKGTDIPLRSSNPKVYLPIGNCLMGHIDGPDAMALAWMNGMGVHQMIGYLEPTWFGYMGWGLLDYFVEQPGRFTLAEAFFANQQALVHELGRDPKSRGLLFDRDRVAFYGDPAWEARMADGTRNWEQALSEKDGVFTFDIKPLAGAKSFEPVNVNGSQRGWRPIFQFLPRRMGPAELLEGADLNPVIADDFLLVPNPRTCDANRTYRVRFRAK